MDLLLKINKEINELKLEIQFMNSQLENYKSVYKKLLVQDSKLRQLRNRIEADTQENNVIEIKNPR